jgi:hypothetical protein
MRRTLWDFARHTQTGIARPPPKSVVFGGEKLVIEQV